jgi:hypothetical protein
MPMRWKVWLGLIASLLLQAACAGSPADWQNADPGIVACRNAYRIVDQAVERTGVRDAEAHRPDAFRYLRSNRFLASFADRPLSDEAFAAWVERMIALDQEGRTVELMNLPLEARPALQARLDAAGAPGDWLEVCPARLRAAELGTAAGRDALREAALVPDDYAAFARTLGLYPLTAVPVALGFERWKDRNLPAFAVPFGEEALRGEQVLFTPMSHRAPMTAPEVAAILEEAAASDPLGIPGPVGETRRRLAMAFAPTLLVDVASPDDRIGHPVWRDDGLPGVDPSRPVAFVRLAHAWFDDRPILQLVYLFWFDARPREGAVDLLAGRLDGLVWRVSLGADGRPLVYDTIHPCGCYHLFFPAPGVERRHVPEDDPGDPREAPLVPATAPPTAPEEQVAARIAATSHYVTGIAARSDAEVGPLEISEYEVVVEDDIPDLELRSMDLPDGGRRSLYGPDGIVSGTERDERVVLWPMGIKEPGAMRQWGRHATAFVGERHFDDAYLLEEVFAR